MITIKQMKTYFNNRDLQIRHNLNAFKYALNKVSREIETDGKKIFLLIVENKPIPELFTHSYSFQTATGRQIIENFKQYYYKYLSNE